LSWTRRIFGALVQGRIRYGLYCKAPFAIGPRSSPICRSTPRGAAPCPIRRRVMLRRGEFPVRRTRARWLRLKRQQRHREAKDQKGKHRSSRHHGLQ